MSCTPIDWETKDKNSFKGFCRVPVIDILGISISRNPSSVEIRLSSHATKGAKVFLHDETLFFRLVNFVSDFLRDTVLSFVDPVFTTIGRFELPAFAAIWFVCTRVESCVRSFENPFGWPWMPACESRIVRAPCWWWFRPAEGQRLCLAFPPALIGLFCRLLGAGFCTGPRLPSANRILQP